MRQAVWQIKQTPTLVTYFIQDTLGKQNKNKLSKKKKTIKNLLFCWVTCQLGQVPSQVQHSLQQLR